MSKIKFNYKNVAYSQNKHNFNYFYLKNPGCLLVISKKMKNSAQSFGFVVTSFQFWLTVTATTPAAPGSRTQNEC